MKNPDSGKKNKKRLESGLKQSSPVNEREGKFIRSYIRGPEKRGLNKQRHILDNFDLQYDKQVVPIVRSSLVEIPFDLVFFNLFTYLEPTLATIEQTRGRKYSLLQFSYLLFVKDLMKLPHIRVDPVIDAYDKFQVRIILYMKRAVILAHLLNTCSYFGMDPVERQVHQAHLSVSLVQKQLCIDTFFDTNSSIKDIREELSVLKTELNSATSVYKDRLKRVFAFIKQRIPLTNYGVVESLKQYICNLSSELQNDDINYFIYLLREYKTTGNLSCLTWLLPYQVKQLEGYFIEIDILLTLIMMHALVENQYLLVSVTRLDFLAKTKIINHPLNIFLEKKECSNSLFGNIIKVLTLNTIEIVQYYYKYCSDNPYMYLNTYMNSQVSPDLSNRGSGPQEAIPIEYIDLTTVQQELSQVLNEKTNVDAVSLVSDSKDPKS